MGEQDAAVTAEAAVAKGADKPDATGKNKPEKKMTLAAKGQDTPHGAGEPDAAHEDGAAVPGDSAAQGCPAEAALAADAYVPQSAPVPGEPGGEPAADSSTTATAHAQDGQDQPAPKLTPSQALLEIIRLLAASPQYKHFFLCDLEWAVLPPFRLGQFRLIHDKGRVVGYVSWAMVNEAVEARLQSGDSKLRPEEWKCGDNLWLVDMATPFGGQAALLNKLRNVIPGNKPIKTVVRGPDGEMKVVEV